AKVPNVVRQKMITPLLERLPDGNWYKSLPHQAKWLHQMSFLEGGSRYARSLSYFYFGADSRHDLYTASVREKLGAADAEDDVATYYLAQESADPVDRMLYADSQSRLPDHPVLISDRMSMAFGLE